MKRIAVLMVCLIASASLGTTISRPAKTGNNCGSGTSFIDGCEPNAADFNNEFDTIVNDYNGNITNVNINTLAGIAPTKIDDLSATASAMDTETSPGSYTSRSAATSLQAEVQRLRYKVAQAGGIEPCVRVNGSGAQVISWVELPRQTENLVANAHFATDMDADGIPDGFAAEGASGGGVVAGASTAEGFGFTWTVAGDDNEGVSYTLDKLRASTRYAIVIRAALSSGAGDITTTGADSASEWRNLDSNLSGASFADYCGVIATDTTPTNIVVKILGDGGAFIASIRDFAVYELAAIPRPSHETYSLATDRDATFSLTAGAGDTASDASIAVTIPDSGYVVRATVDGWCVQDTTGAGGMSLDIEEDGTDILDAVFFGNSSGGSVTAGAIFPFSFTRVSVNPSAGSHTYRVAGSATTRDWTCTSVNLLVERKRLQ